MREGRDYRERKLGGSERQIEEVGGQERTKAHWKDGGFLQSLWHRLHVRSHKG